MLSVRSIEIYNAVYEGLYSQAEEIFPASPSEVLRKFNTLDLYAAVMDFCCGYVSTKEIHTPEWRRCVVVVGEEVSARMERLIYAFRE